MDDSGRRTIQTIVIKVFGRIDPRIYNSIRYIFRKVIGKGYAAIPYSVSYILASCALRTNGWYYFIQE